MSAISIKDKVVCAHERCDLTICTDEAGERAFHYLERDQMDRLIRPLYSDSPFQRLASDLDGEEHEAVIPDELLNRDLRGAPLRALLRGLSRCPWVV